MEQREERPNLFGLSQVVTEEGESKEEGEANLLLAQGRMERSGMAPWVSRTTHKNNALQGDGAYHLFFDTQGAASLCPGLMAFAPSGRGTQENIDCQNGLV